MLLAIEFDNLHQILRSLYTDMMPLCGNMAGVAKGIAGLGALFYVAAKVWQSLASAEPIDVYPLLRPFVIGFCIMFFPTFVLGTINSVMSPVVKGCNNMLETHTFDMNACRVCTWIGQPTISSNPSGIGSGNFWNCSFNRQPL